MKLQLKYTFLTALLAAAIFACKDKNDVVTPDPEPDPDTIPVVVQPKDSIVDEYTTLRVNGVVEVKDLPSLKGADYAEYSLYSFEKMKLVGKGVDSAKTLSWDLAFSNASGIDVVPNWGGTAPDHWDGPDLPAGNLSDIKAVIYEDTTFDAVTTVPAEAAFDHAFNITTAGSVTNTETGLFDHYSFFKPIIIFKLNDGRYVKFQYTSFYKGAPENPTAQNEKNDKGYWTFKYYITKAGSKDLTTTTK